MVAARNRLDIATANLANVSTDGFARVLARGTLTPSGVTISRETSEARGALRRTGRDFDLAIVGEGAFRLRDARGRTTATRNGAFVRERNGTLSDRAGRILLGRSGPLHVPDGGRIDERGRVMLGERCVDRVPIPSNATVRAGFLETSAVDAIGEMIGVLSAERSFESAQKVVSAIDRTREKSAGDVARVK